MVIQWEAFSWEAFSTLVTGLAAVLAAWSIGKRQVGIAEKQADILKRQVLLDEFKLRTDLFERRFAVYDATRNYLSLLLRDADRPDQEPMVRFLLGMDQARFLFKDEVHARLDDLWKRCNRFYASKANAQHLYRTEGHYGEANIEHEYEFLGWASELNVNLADLFGDELRLSAPTASPQ
jgi:hypothetical protein